MLWVDVKDFKLGGAMLSVRLRLICWHGFQNNRFLN